MRSIGVKLTLDNTGFLGPLTRAGTATKDFVGQLDKAAKAGHLNAVADQSIRMGVAGAAAFGLVVKSAADFDKQMSAVSAATKAGGKDLDALRQAALQAGKDTQYSATQAADGITQLSKAGVQTADILNGGLNGALSLAAAGQLDVGEAAETAASAMTQFKLQGGQVPHVADLLAAAAGNAQGSVHDLGYALSQSGLVASQMGLSIEDATGTLAAFASAGLLGSDSGTSFKTMLLALQNPSAKTADLMKDLGISAYDAQGNFVGIAKFAGILQEKLSNLTPQVRQQALAQMFGNDAVRAGTILYDQGAAGIQKWIDKTNDAGYAADTAAKLTDNLAGDIERLKGSLETMAIEAGSGANGGLRVLVKGVEGLVDQFAALPPVVGSSLTVLAGVGGVAALALGGFIKVRRGIAEAVTQLNAMGPAGEKAATGLTRAASAAGKAAIAFAVWQAAMTAADAIQGNTATNVDAMAVGLEKFGRGAGLSGEAARVLGGDLENLTSGFKYLADADNGRRKVVKSLQESLEAVTPGLAGYSKSLTNTQAQVTAIDQSLASMVAAGNAAQAEASFQRLIDALAVGGVTVEEVRKQFPGYAAAVEQAGGSTVKLAHAMNFMGPTVDEARTAIDGATGAAKGVAGPTAEAAEKTRDYASAADAAAGAARGELGAMTDLSNRMKAEADPVFALLNAQRDLSKAQRDAKRDQEALSTAIKEHGAKSTQARTASDNLKTSTRNLALAAIDLQGKAGALGTTFDGKLSPSMVQTLKAAKLTDAQIAAVGRQFADAKKKGDAYAGAYNANVSVTGDKAAAAKLASLQVQQLALRKGVSMSAARALAGDAASAKDRGLFAAGGWTGPGAKYEPAGIVHADEFVIQKSSRQAIEAQAPGLLDSMNATGRAPGYARGGQVAWPYPATAAMTKIPSLEDVLAVVTPGGATYRWIEAVARAAFPGMAVLSDYRPGSRTLSGSVSYHASGRAVDFPPSRPLAQFFHDHYMSRLKELITPYNDLNVWNGAPHQYTGAIWNQHNFAGGNAHDHVAMLNGGVIPEPVIGVGASGRTYSFAENGLPERVLPSYATSSRGGGNSISYTINVEVSPLSHPREVGRQTVLAIQEYEHGSGTAWRD